jgi:hypothetical protein
MRAGAKKGKSKLFFFEKKNQKTFAPLVPTLMTACA